MMLAACVLSEVDASKVELSPGVASLPAESQLLIQERLSAVLLKRVYLLGHCLHSHFTEHP